MESIGQSQTGCALQRREVDGHRVLTIENESVRISIDVDHGAHLYEITDKQSNVNVLYQDPNGLNYTVGGWYELFPNAGKACTYNGSEVPQHGDVQHLPWEYRIEAENDAEVRVHFRTESRVRPFALERTVAIRSGESNIYIMEKMTSLSQADERYLWGHHVTFGAPYLSAFVRIDLPECRVFDQPVFHPSGSRLVSGASGSLDSMPGANGERVDLTYFPADPFAEMLFIDQLEDCWYNIYNEGIGLGFALSWDKEAFPCLWLWQEHHSSGNEKKGGASYGMALEPQASNVPILANAAAEDQAPVLQPGRSVETWLTVSLHHVPDRVKHVSKDGRIVYS